MTGKWFKGETRPEAVLYRKVHESEVVETPRGKTVADPGNYLVRRDGAVEEYSPDEFHSNFKTE